VEIMPDVALPRMRLFADRWLCCVWAAELDQADPAASAGQ